MVKTEYKMNDTNMEFDPGDIVRLVLDPSTWVQIVEVIQKTCPGGTQIEYICRTVVGRGRETSSTWIGSSSLSQSMMVFNCVEVEAVPTVDEFEERILNVISEASARGHLGLAKRFQDTFDQFKNKIKEEEHGP